MSKYSIELEPVGSHETNPFQRQENYKKLINKIPGDDGWCKDGNYVYYDIFLILTNDYNIPEDRAFRLLNNAYWTAAEEYGA